MKKMTKRKTHRFPIKTLIVALVGGIVAAVLVKADRHGDQKFESFSIRAINSSSEKRAQERLDNILKTHPSREIKDNLSRFLIERGGYISIDSMPDTPWAMGALGADYKDGRIVPVLRINRDAILDRANSDKKWQLVIYHEYQHLLDFVRGVEPPESFLVRDLSKISEQEARRAFANELRAYLAQCRLAASLHWESEFELCSSFTNGGEAGLRQVVAAQMANDSRLARHRGLFLRLGEGN